MPNKKIDKLSKEYFEDFIKIFPPYATCMGIHDYDEEMPDGTLASYMAFRKRRKKFYNDIKNLDPSNLSFDKKIDREALLMTLEVQMFEDEAHGRLYSLPNIGEEISSSLYLLFIKEFAPFEERIRRITKRLEKVPSYIENHKEVLKDPVALWFEFGSKECQGAAEFIELIESTASEKGLDENVLDLLKKASKSAKESLSQFSDWLKNKIPNARSSFNMKPEDYNKLIELRNLGMSIDEMLEFAQNTLIETRKKEKEMAKKIAPNKTIEEFRNIMRAKRPENFEEALAKTREAVKESRKFILENNFATIPQEEELMVIETPDFSKPQIPFGAYMPPGKFDKFQVGQYFLTPPPKETNFESLHKGAILNTSVHEGYPGHHLHLVCANSNQSPSRLLTDANEVVEGWAHYCEEMVARMGFSTEPEVMFERYNDIIWRAARIIIDIKLSRGEMTFDEASEYLHKETGFNKKSCNQEILWYTFSPGYQLSYLIGKKCILDLLEKTQKDAKENFNLKKFHDTILYSGILPISSLEKVVRKNFNLT